MSPGWDRCPLLETQNPKSGAQKEAKKKILQLSSKKRMDCICHLDWDMGIILCALSLWKLCSDERKNLRINHSSCTEKQPMRNRATRQLIALWLFEAW